MLSCDVVMLDKQFLPHDAHAVAFFADCLDFERRETKRLHNFGIGTSGLLSSEEIMQFAEGEDLKEKIEIVGIDL